MEMLPAILSAKQQKTAGEIQRLESQTQAKQIETQAAAQEADRKEQLARAAAAQAARAGGAGIEFEGSPLTVLQEDIRREEEAGQRAGFTSQLAAFSERERGSIARSMANRAANISLLKQTMDTASSAAKAGAGGGA